MALSPESLKSRIIAELESEPYAFILTGEHAWGEKLATAIANAVVDEITSNAEVHTLSGAPDGEHTGEVR